MEDLFDDFFKKTGRGGRFEYSALERREVFDHFLRLGNLIIDTLRASSPNLPKPYIDFINNTSLNACATKISNQYIIGINFGTVLLHHDIFYRMLSHKEVFTEIGDSSKETDKNRVFNAQITDFSKIVLRPESDDDIIPKDRTRLLVAQMLEELAFISIIIHEYAHIVFGHVDYLSTINNNSAIYENPNFDTNLKFSPLLLQTLELDADSYSASVGMEWLKMSMQNQQNIHPEMRQFFSNWPDMIKYWDIAAYTSKRLFGYEPDKVANYKNLSHPLPGLRQHINLATIASIFFNKNDSDFASRTAVIGRDVAIAVESAFEKISEQQYNTDSFMFAYTQEGQDQLKLLSNNWNIVRPLLEPLAFAKLAPNYTED